MVGFQVGVPARPDDGLSTAAGGRIAELAGVAGALCGDACRILIHGDLAEQVDQGRRSADVASGDLDCLDVQGLLVDPGGGSCAVNPVAPRLRKVMAKPPLGATVPAGVPIVGKTAHRTVFLFLLTLRPRP